MRPQAKKNPEKSLLKSDLSLKTHFNVSLLPAKAQSFHSPIKDPPPVDDFALDLTLENFYHPTANSLRPVFSNNYFFAKVYLDSGFELFDSHMLKATFPEPHS